MKPWRHIVTFHWVVEGAILGFHSLLRFSRIVCFPSSKHVHTTLSDSRSEMNFIAKSHSDKFTSNPRNNGKLNWLHVVQMLCVQLLKSVALRKTCNEMSMKPWYLISLFVIRLILEIYKSFLYNQKLVIIRITKELLSVDVLLNVWSNIRFHYKTTKENQQKEPFFFIIVFLPIHIISISC